eukprot:Gb_07297 [translate_table: standard]
MEPLDLSELPYVEFASMFEEVTEGDQGTLIEGHISQYSLSDQNGLKSNGQNPTPKLPKDIQKAQKNRVVAKKDRLPFPPIENYVSEKGRQKRFRGNNEHKELGRGKSTYKGVDRNGKKWQSRICVKRSDLIKAEEGIDE